MLTFCNMATPKSHLLRANRKRELSGDVAPQNSRGWKPAGSPGPLRSAGFRLRLLTKVPHNRHATLTNPASLPMRACCLREMSEVAAYADVWDRLAAGMPMHTFPWCASWWRHYGPSDATAARQLQLHVLAVFDESDRLVGVAPWYRQWTPTAGWALRSLGDGEVCSDYPTLLLQPGREEAVAAAMAEYLHGAHGESSGTQAGEGHDLRNEHWDLIDLECVVDDDGPLERLIVELARLGHTVHRRPGPNVWRIPLPETWDDYLKMLSKDHRKRIRRLMRGTVDPGRAVIERVKRVEQLPPAMDTLIDLHQRRWRGAGKPGCFASTRYEAFHRELAAHLLRAGHLNLSILHLDGTPAAAQYAYTGGGIVYSYQAGVDPERRDDEPGRLAQAMVIRWAIEHGYRGFDLLRGDEPYKPHWRAEPTASHHVRIVAPQSIAQWRHRIWLAGRSAKHWSRGGLALLPGGREGVRGDTAT